MLFQIADIILILHFGIILFITSLFFLIPVGYKFNWIFTKNIKIRYFHAGLMTFVTIETFLGIACPITYWRIILKMKMKTNYFYLIG